MFRELPNREWNGRPGRTFAAYSGPSFASLLGPLHFDYGLCGVLESILHGSWGEQVDPEQSHGQPGHDGADRIASNFRGDYDVGQGREQVVVSGTEDRNSVQLYAQGFTICDAQGQVLYRSYEPPVPPAGAAEPLGAQEWLDWASTSG